MVGAAVAPAVAEDARSRRRPLHASERESERERTGGRERRGREAFGK